MGGKGFELLFAMGSFGVIQVRTAPYVHKNGNTSYTAQTSRDLVWYLHLGYIAFSLLSLALHVMSYIPSCSILLYPILEFYFFLNFILLSSFSYCSFNLLYLLIFCHVFKQFMGAIQFLPACRMFLAMCPEGAEGSATFMISSLLYMLSLSQSVSRLVSSRYACQSVR